MEQIQNRVRELLRTVNTWVIEMDINDKGVAHMRPEWFPLYV